MTHCNGIVSSYDNICQASTVSLAVRKANSVAHIYDAIPGSHPQKHQLSPDERFCGRKTSIQHLQIFATKCYVNVMNKKKGHQLRSRRGILVG